MTQPDAEDRFDGRRFAAPHDIADIEYRRDLGDPGSFPFTRGQSAGTRSEQAWIHRELSGEGDARQSNAQLRYLIQHGATGLDVIGDAPTVGLIDPDHPFARYSVGTQGVSLCRLQDFFDLYDAVPLDHVSVSHSLPACFTVAGLYLTAERQGVDPALVRGSVINAPFFAEDYAYATHLPFGIRMRMALDAIEFATGRLPRFHPFVEDTYFISDGGIGPVEEMALGFVEIRAVVRGLLARGLDIDSFGRRIAILVNCRMDLITEIAKIRATRRIFARTMRDEFGARDPRTWSSNITVHTSGAAMTAQQPINNIIRGAFQAMAMAMAGVKAMEISAFDEAYRTPSEEAHIVGLRTQQILDLETDVADYVDPLGGSYLIEHRTDEIERQILERVAEIESSGSPDDLFARGEFARLFQAAMSGRGRAVLDGTLPVVGVNCHTIPEEADRMLREYTDAKIDPYLDHIETIRRWKAGRDQPTVDAAIEHLAGVAASDENMMPAIVDGFVAQATIGEMTATIRAANGLPADPLAKRIDRAS